MLWSQKKLHVIVSYTCLSNLSAKLVQILEAEDNVRNMVAINKDRTYIIGNIMFQSYHLSEFCKHQSAETYWIWKRALGCFVRSAANYGKAQNNNELSWCNRWWHWKVIKVDYSFCIMHTSPFYKLTIKAQKVTLALARSVCLFVHFYFRRFNWIVCFCLSFWMRCTTSS